MPDKLIRGSERDSAKTESEKKGQLSVFRLPLGRMKDLETKLLPLASKVFDGKKKRS